MRTHLFDILTISFINFILYCDCFTQFQSVSITFKCPYCDLGGDSINILSLIPCDNCTVPGYDVISACTCCLEHIGVNAKLPCPSDLFLFSPYNSLTNTDMFPQDQKHHCCRSAFKTPFPTNIPTSITFQKQLNLSSENSPSPTTLIVSISTNHSSTAPTISTTSSPTNVTSQPSRAPTHNPTMLRTKQPSKSSSRKPIKCKPTTRPSKRPQLRSSPR